MLDSIGATSLEQLVADGAGNDSTAERHWHSPSRVRKEKRSPRCGPLPA
jgi:hypothetical protein